WSSSFRASALIEAVAIEPVVAVVVTEPAEPAPVTMAEPARLVTIETAVAQAKASIERAERPGGQPDTRGALIAAAPPPLGRSGRGEHAEADGQCDGPGDQCCLSRHHFFLLLLRKRRERLPSGSTTRKVGGLFCRATASAAPWV